MKRLHVAAAQIISQGGPPQTLARIDALAQAASLLGADVILFAELAVNGYDYQMTTADVRRQAEPLDGPIAQTILASAARHGITILSGFIERDGEAIYNSHLIAEPSGPLQVQRKHMLTEPEIQAGFSPGPRKRLIFALNHVRCALIICADTGIQGLPEELRTDQVDLRFIPTGGGGKIADMLQQNELATEEGCRRYTENRPRVCHIDAFDTKAKEWGSGFVSANALGPIGRETCHQGHCLIVDSQGVLRAQAVGTIVLEHMHEQLINAVLTWP